MELEASVIHGSPVTSIIVNSTLKLMIANPLLFLISINGVSNSTSVNMHLLLMIQQFISQIMIMFLLIIKPQP